jgi:hypothetical protein
VIEIDEGAQRRGIFTRAREKGDAGLGAGAAILRDGFGKRSLLTPRIHMQKK